MNIKRKLIVIFTFLFSLFSSYSQMVLGNYNTTWNTVIPGKVLCDPVETSAGFVIYSDAKTISYFSHKGTLLWERKAGYSSEVRGLKIFRLENDFLLVTKNGGTKFEILNPSGNTILQKELDFEILEAISGRDGRIFIKGNNKIECYCMTGVRKWALDVQSLSNIQLQELPDGSIIALFMQLEDGKTKGLRISPFGEILEEIVFSGNILAAFTGSDGIFLTFADGSAGFFSLGEDKAGCINKWVLDNNKKGTESSLFAISNDKKYVLYITEAAGGVEVYKVLIESGTIENHFVVKNIDGKKIKIAEYRNGHCFICDENYGFLFTDSGKEITALKFQSNKSFKWNYVLYTKHNDLMFFGTNWTINSYKIEQESNSSATVKADKYKDFLPQQVNEYKFAFINNLDTELASPEIVSQLHQGDYGKNELQWARNLQEACLGFNNSLLSLSGNSRQEQTVFDIDNSGTQIMLSQLSAFGTTLFNNYIVSFLNKTNNKSYILALLNGISYNGYDPEGELLAALDKVSKKLSYKDETLLIKVCDGVYSICSYMGRPAFNARGKSILANFLYPKFSSAVKSYARQTLKKITALDL